VITRAAALLFTVSYSCAFLTDSNGRVSAAKFTHLMGAGWCPTTSS